MTETWRDRLPLALSFLIVLAYALIDRYGPAASHDSLYYLEGASYWLQTGTFSNMYWGSVLPEVHYAPLFSGILAALSFFSGMDPRSIADILLPFVAAWNLGLVDLILKRLKLPWHAICLLLLLLASTYAFFSIHWHIWSEPFYLSFLLIAALGIMQAVDSQKARWVLFAALMAGLSVLVRYAGLFMFPFLVLWLFFALKENRWRNSLLFSLVSLLPFVAWTIRNKISSGALHSRKYFWDWAGLGEFLRAFEVYFSWTGWVIILLVMILYVRVQKQSISPMIWIWLAGSIIYVVLLILAKSSIDAQIPIDARMLSPLLVPTVLITGSLMQQWPIKWRLPLLGLAFTASMVQAWPFAADAYHEGWSFHQRSLRAPGSPVYQIRAALPDSARLFATDVDGHYLAYMLNRPVTYHHFGDTLQPGGWYVRWQTEMPLETTTRDAIEVVPDLVWHRKPLP